MPSRLAIRLFATALLVVAAGALLARAASAQVRVVPKPIMLRLRGHVGPPPPGRSSLADLALDVRGQRIRLQVDDAYVLQGDRLGADVLADVTPFEPNFFVHGPDELLDRLLKANPGDSVEMIGTARSPSREYLLRSVKVTPKS